MSDIKTTETDDDFDRQYNIISQVEDAAGGFPHSTWSVYEMVKTVDSFKEVVYDQDIKLVYKTDTFWTKPNVRPDESEDLELSVNIPGPVTWLDLWRASDALIFESGDSHHIFIEGFSEIEPGVIEFYTGS